MDTSAPVRKRRSTTKRVRTRQALIDAAAALIREKGYERTTLADVAARAGMARGAIYGNFKDRSDLFAAVASSRSPPVVPEPKSGATFKAQMRAMGEAVAKAARERRPDGVHRAAFQMYVLTDEAMRLRLEAQHNEVRRAIVAAWRRALPSDSLPLPAERLVKIIAALTDGLLTAHFQSPDAFDEELIVAAFEALS